MRDESDVTKENLATVDDLSNYNNRRRLFKKGLIKHSNTKH